MENAGHTIPIGTKVRVQVGYGWHGGEYHKRTAWFVGYVVGHTRIGEAVQPGGWPTYDVKLRNGERYETCAPECVRLA
jgi:hypothetical protein